MAIMLRMAVLDVNERSISGTARTVGVAGFWGSRCTGSQSEGIRRHGIEAQIFPE
jgi:hypothetical protein